MALCWSLDKDRPDPPRGDTTQVLAVTNGFNSRDTCGIKAPFGRDATRSAIGLRAGYVAAYHSLARLTIVAPLFYEAAALTLGGALEAALCVAHRRPNLA